MLTFLLVVHALITATLVGVILMQRSEGGGLGMGGSPTGLMSARGAADFLTRATTILATLFVGLSITSAVVVSRNASPSTIDTSLAHKGVTPAPTPATPVSSDPLAAAAGSVPNANPASATTPAQIAPMPASPPVTAQATHVVHKPSQAADAPARIAVPVERPIVVPTRPAPTPSLTPAPAVPRAPVGPPVDNAN